LVEGGEADLLGKSIGDEEGVEVFEVGEANSKAMSLWA
jgi:hypothetical protein